ncbi:MAG: DNA-binding protein [Bacteroidales bacterium]|nr:DNA-binding protein [Bacteroidales bacterium]
MASNLTTSNIDRQNVLNNRFAVEAIQERLGFKGLFFEGEFRYTKQMVADFYQVDVRTIERCIEENEDELTHNGYFLCRGKRLKEFKLQFVSDINVGNKAQRLSLFNFRSFLNLGMLLVESEPARKLRNLILDIVISTINEKAGGGTKYINRRDEEYLGAAIQETNYRKVFTEAVGRYVVGHSTYKYAQVTDMIYKAVFKEKAKEYRELLKLKSSDNVKATLYAEVLRVISSFEVTIGKEITKRATEGNRQLEQKEVEEIVQQIAETPMMEPFLHDARTKMASRDLSLREVLHNNIKEYLEPMSPEDFEKFLGEQSVDFDKILADNQDVLRRLKQAEDE